MHDSGCQALTPLARSHRHAGPNREDATQDMDKGEQPPLQALIFDVDGTLADTERYGHWPAYNQAFDDLGADWSWSESEYSELLQVEGGHERLQHYLDIYRPDFAPDQGYTDFVEEAHDRKNRHYRDRLQSGAVPLRPGIRRLIAEARADGLRLAIASSSLRSNVTALLSHAVDEHAEDWFEAIVTGSESERKKPDPDIYRRVLDRLDLEPLACIAIEDSENGCRSAVSAGVPTIVTTSTYTGDHAFNGAALVTDSLGEPDRPWNILAGPHPGTEYLDTTALRRIHARAIARA